MEKEEFIKKILDAFLTGSKSVCWISSNPDEGYLKQQWSTDALSILINEYSFNPDLFSWTYNSLTYKYK